METDPTRALADRRRHTPEFCRQYFDLCDDNSLGADRTALERPELVLDPARVALELAERTGDRHLVHRSLGVLAHAHLAVEQPDEARSLLEDSRRAALRCCPACKAGWFHRHGDYLVEVRDGAAARKSLNGSLRAAESPDEAARALFVRGISRYYTGKLTAAFEDELRVLETLDLGSPRSYFVDALAILAVFLRGAEPSDDKRVLKHLGAFEDRLLGVRGATEVRRRLRWVVGQLCARLGNFRGVLDRLESVRHELRASGPLLHEVAVALDLAMVYCRTFYVPNFDRVKRILRGCEQRLSYVGEEQKVRQQLLTVLWVLEEDPDKVLDALVGARTSFVVPVPGLVWERLTTASRVERRPLQRPCGLV